MQLDIRNDENNEVTNIVYGTHYNSLMTVIVNESPSDITVLKAINTESNKAFDIIIKSYLNAETTSITRSTLADTEFENKEGKWYDYLRSNELAGDLTAKSAYGVGMVDGVVTSTITMKTAIPTALISVGDNLYDAANTLIGEIQSINTTNNTIVVDTTPSISNDTFLYGLKTARIEGSENRGYNFEVNIVDTSTSRTELFALNSEVIKSNTS